MKVTKVKSGDAKIKFVLDKTTFGFTNALRRAAMFEVPTLAIEDIYFIDNSSALYDEMVAHRLGLIPLTTDLKTFKTPADCTCKGKGCVKCEIKLTLKEKGPKLVYASDLKSTDSTVKPVYPNTPIVELLEGQEIELEAVAKLGHGSTHVKWSPCLAYYFRHPKKKVDVSKIEHYDVWMEQNKDSGEDDKFIFVIEPWGQLPAKQILKQAVKMVQNKLTEVKLR